MAGVAEGVSAIRDTCRVAEPLGLGFWARRGGCAACGGVASPISNSVGQKRAWAASAAWGHGGGISTVRHKLGRDGKLRIAKVASIRELVTNRLGSGGGDMALASDSSPARRSASRARAKAKGKRWGMTMGPYLAAAAEEDDSGLVS